MLNAPQIDHNWHISKAANGKNFAVFHTIAKSGVLILAMIWKTFRYSAKEYWHYRGGSRGVSRFLPKVSL